MVQWYIVQELAAPRPQHNSIIIEDLRSRNLVLRPQARSTIWKIDGLSALGILKKSMICLGRFGDSSLVDRLTHPPK